MVEKNIGKLKKGKITVMGVLRYISDNADIMFPTNRKEGYNLLWRQDWPEWENYFPSDIIRAANRLERKGLVTKKQTPQGLIVKISDKGKTEILKYNIKNWQPKTDKWDGKWRLALFDVEEKRRSKRVQLIKYLKTLGMVELQKSVYISPYDIEKEIKYLREVMEIPNNIKIAVIERIENKEELTEIFGV